MQLTRLIHKCDEDYDFSGVQPFIFSPKDPDQVSFDDDQDVILACPFQKFSIEIDGYHGLCGDFNNQLGFEAHFIFRCIFVNELSPADYDLVVLVEIWVDDELDRVVCTPYKSGDNDCIREFRPIISEYLKRLHTEDNGSVSCHGKAKYKLPDGVKAEFKPSSVIYIGKKGCAERTYESRPIDWTTSWNVMAHWRRLLNPESLGIGRDGERNIKGHTWITSFKKGDGPLVEKIRKVM